MGIRDNKIPSRGTRIISESRGVLSLMGFFCSHFLRWRMGKCPNKLRNFIKYPSLASKLSTSALSATLHHFDSTQWIFYKYSGFLYGCNFTYLYSYIYAP